MLNIEVSSEYKVVSDGTQVVVQKKSLVDPKNSKSFDPETMSSEIYEVFKPWKYCSSLKQALKVILNQKILDSEAKTLKEVVCIISSFEKYVEKELKGY